MNMDDLEVPLFLETSIWQLDHLYHGCYSTKSFFEVGVFGFPTVFFSGISNCVMPDILLTIKWQRRILYPDNVPKKLQGINISHLGKRKIIFKSAIFGGYVSSLEGNTMISNMIILNRKRNFLISMAHTVKMMAAQLEYLFELQRLIDMPWIGLTFMNLKILKFEDEFMRNISLRKTKTYFWYGAHDEIKVPTLIISVSSLRQLPLQWSSLKDERAVSRRPPYHRPTPRQTHLRWVWFHGYFRSINT